MYVSRFSLFYAFSLYTHNDTISALGHSQDMFLDTTDLCTFSEGHLHHGPHMEIFFTHSFEQGLMKKLAQMTVLT